MNIIVNTTSMVPIYEQIVDQVKTMILNGTLEKEALLPSVRTLAKELKISALTVKKAYGSRRIYSDHSWKRNLCKYDRSKPGIGTAPERSRG